MFCSYHHRPLLVTQSRSYNRAKRLYQVSSSETRPVHNSVERCTNLFILRFRWQGRPGSSHSSNKFFGAFLPSQSSQVPSSKPQVKLAATRNKEHGTCARDESYSSKITLHFPLSKKLDAPKSYISSPTHFLGVTTFYIQGCMYVCMCVYINKTLGGKSATKLANVCVDYCTKKCLFMY